LLVDLASEHVDRQCQQNSREEAAPSLGGPGGGEQPRAADWWALARCELAVGSCPGAGAGGHL